MQHLRSQTADGGKETMKPIERLTDSGIKQRFHGFRGGSPF